MIKQIFIRLYQLFFYPRSTWEKIKSENVDGDVLRKTFYFPLILMMIFCALVGSFSQYLFEVQLDLSSIFLESIKNAAIFLMAYFLGFFMQTLIFNELLRSSIFEMDRDLHKCFTFFAYSSSLMWCTKSLILLFPNLVVIYWFNIYALYLVWTGSIVLFEDLKEEKRTHFTLIAVFLLYFTPYLIETIMQNLIP